MKYRKKPVVIEAYQTDKEMDIETLEGTMHASVGDYIITGVRGEQYPCKPDIFEQTYEPADTPIASPWHRVEEELPNDGHWAIFTNGKVVSVERFKEDAYNHFFPASEWFDFEDAIAWMPLPEPPNEGNK